LITKNIVAFECSYCGTKFDNENECLRHEAKHLDSFNSEKTRFDKFVEELVDINIVKNVRPEETVTKTVTVTEMVPTGDIDTDGNPVMEPTEVEKEVEETVLGDLPTIYCSKCMKPVGENHSYIKVFGYNLCMDCMIPVLQSFAKNYTNFKSQFLTYMNSSNPFNSKFNVDNEGNIVADTSKGMIISKGNCSCEHRHYH